MYICLNTVEKRSLLVHKCFVFFRRRRRKFLRFWGTKNLHVVVVVVVVVVGLYIWPLGPEIPVSAPLFPRTAGV